MDIPEKTSQIRSSLLLVLDEKNSVINKLRAQINNQKVQLKYYIRKNIRHLELNRLKETCSIDLATSSIPVDLAMSKFFKENGIKSKLMTLYEKMYVIDKKITYVLNSQQLMIRQITDKILAHQLGQENDQNNIVISKEHFEMFNALMQKTVRLTRTLEIFRICCDRVILTEDEKNSIVEHVYSLPLKQRINSNYLADVHMEKLRLENDIKKVLKEQHFLKKKIKQIIFMDNKLKNFQFADDPPDNILLDKMKNLNHEAVKLLEKSEQKKSTQFKIQQVLDIVTDALKNLIKGNFEVPSEYKDEHHDMYKSILSLLDFEVNLKCVKQFNDKSNQCKILKTEVQTLSCLRDKLLINLKNTEDELKQVRVQQKNDVVKFYFDTNGLRKDVTKLSKMVEFYKDTISTRTEELYSYRTAIREKNKKIIELQNINTSLSTENEKLKDLATKSKYQLKYILKMASLGKDLPEEELEMLKNSIPGAHLEGEIQNQNAENCKELKDLYFANADKFGNCTDGSTSTFVADPRPFSERFRKKRPRSELHQHLEMRQVFQESTSAYKATRSPKCFAINEHQSYPTCYPQ